MVRLHRSFARVDSRCSEVDQILLRERERERDRDRDNSTAEMVLPRCMDYSDTRLVQLVCCSVGIQHQSKLLSLNCRTGACLCGCALSFNRYPLITPIFPTSKFIILGQFLRVDLMKPKRQTSFQSENFLSTNDWNEVWCLGRGR